MRIRVRLARGTMKEKDYGFSFGFGMKMLYALILLISTSCVSAQNLMPKFGDYAVNKIYHGTNHPLALDSYGKNYRTKLREAIANNKPNFAGHYIVTSWVEGCGNCITGAVIDAETGRAYPFPVSMSSVSPLKPEFEKNGEDGQELVYKLNSRLIMFAGNLDTDQGDGEDKIEFYEFTNNKFVFVKSMLYGRGNSQ